LIFITIQCLPIDGFAYYEEWQDVMKKADEESKALLRRYGDTLKQRDDVCTVCPNQKLHYR
jgi:hypothetical protein